MNDAAFNTEQKALALNRDRMPYGTFAEIGGGQEVARWFFYVGGAAGTVAKTISAYDMAVSDAVYGPAQQYVSRKRLEAMLDYEFGLLLERLGARRGDTTTFFAFADTVAIRSYHHPEKGRGWMGIRFQSQPREKPSEIIVHVHLFDSTAVRQQEALGVLGVNLIYAAFYRRNPAALIGSLMDELSRERVELDMIKLSGPAFAGVDNRLMSLQLVEQNLTDAAMFTASGEVVQPSEVLHKRPILVERGNFRPITRLTLDLLERAREQFIEEPGVLGQQPVVLAEMTLRSLIPGPEIGHSDFLDRADILGALGIDVVISRVEPYYQLADYLAAYTDRMIGIAVGLPSVKEIADEKYYPDVPGGVLEAAGRLFKRTVKMYVYPGRDPRSGRVYTVETAPLPSPWQHLRALLLEIHRLEPIRHYNESYLTIFPQDALAKIGRNDPGWEEMVPPLVAEMIKTKGLFGYQATRGRNRSDPSVSLSSS
ncbi:MAG: TonB-dependent receptor [Candidatus Binatia bacterium]